MTLSKRFTLLLVLLLPASIPVIAQELSYDCELRLPEMISTRGGQDSLHWLSSCEVLEMDFKLFNRWGQEVYTSASIDSPFDFDITLRDPKRGNTYVIPDGTYFWAAEYTVLVGDMTLELKRNGTLVVIH